MKASKNDARNSAIRAIRALAQAIEVIDAGGWYTLLEDQIPHIEANIAHLRREAEAGWRGDA